MQEGCIKWPWPSSKMKKVIISLSLSPGLIEKIDKMPGDYKSRSQKVEYILKRYFEQNPGPGKKPPPIDENRVRALIKEILQQQQIVKPVEQQEPVEIDKELEEKAKKTMSNILKMREGLS